MNIHRSEGNSTCTSTSCYQRKTVCPSRWVHVYIGLQNPCVKGHFSGAKVIEARLFFALFLSFALESIAKWQTFKSRFCPKRHPGIDFDIKRTNDTATSKRLLIPTRYNSGAAGTQDYEEEFMVKKNDMSRRRFARPAAAMAAISPFSRECLSNAGARRGPWSLQITIPPARPRVKT